MTKRQRTCRLGAVLLGLALAGSGAGAQETGPLTVTLLGTGTPSADPNRAGFANLVQAGDTVLLFDAGRNVVTRLQQMHMAVGEIDAVFVTHFHSDHVNGLADLFLTGYLTGPIGRRAGALALYGPTGVQPLADGIRAAHLADIETRVADEGVKPEATQFDVHEVTPGVVYDQNGVTVTMFAVHHGDKIDPAVGYRVDYAGKSVTFSGDTKFDPGVIAAGTGTDLLIHSLGTAPVPMLDLPFVKRILDHHTAPQEAGQVFTQAAPKLAVLSHVVRLDTAEHGKVSMGEIVDRVRTTYDGPLIVGEDLMQFRIGDSLAVLRADD